MNTSAHDIQITARVIPESERLDMLPKHFGRYLMVVENMIYGWTRRLVPNYTGAYWQFYELSNNGFYMAPSIDKSHVSVEGNGFEGEMSADAIGITACLFAYSHGSFQFRSETFGNHYHWLREYSYFHPAAQLISAACD